MEGQSNLHQQEKCNSGQKVRFLGDVKMQSCNSFLDLNLTEAEISIELAAENSDRDKTSQGEIQT